MRIDFQHQPPQLSGEDILMCLVRGLSQAYGYAATERLSEFNSPYSSAFVYIEDSDPPPPGKGYTYGNLTTTLEGIGLYMSENDRYMTTSFRIYDVSISTEASLVGTGWIAVN